MSSHARLSPSNLRWPKCPGSIEAELLYPDIAGAAAIDGTGTHLLLELSLLKGVSADHFDRDIIGANHEDQPNGWLVDAERCKRAQMCLDYIGRRVAELKDQFIGAEVTVEAESKSDPGGAFGRTDWNGTSDVTIIVRHKMTGACLFIEVIDYKDGRGYVQIKDNTQLISYLFGRMREYIASGPDRVRPFIGEKLHGCRMTIVQPKTNPAVRYVCSTRPDDNFSVEHVIEKAIELSEAADKTDEVNASRTAGKHCQWCKANPKRGGHCDTQIKESINVVNDNQILDLNSLSKVITESSNMTNEELSRIAYAEVGIQAAFDVVKSEIEKRIIAGQVVDGYAMNPGRGSNKWAHDNETIAKRLKGRRLKLDEVFPKKLITPAAALKLNSLSDEQKERIKKDLIVFVAGKLTLQKVAHEPVEKSADQLFPTIPLDTPTFL